MAKRRKRRSQKSFDQRLMKDIRKKRLEFLRELSEMVSNSVGARIRCTFVGGEVVVPQPKKPRSGKADRKLGHVAGYGTEPPADHELQAAPDLANDPIPF